VRGQKLLGAQLLGEPLAIGRDADAESLSCATFARTVGCRSVKAISTAKGRSSVPTTGWQFEPHTGQCQVIPSLTSDSKLKVEPYLLRKLSL